MIRWSSSVCGLLVGLFLSGMVLGGQSPLSQSLQSSPQSSIDERVQKMLTRTSATRSGWIELGPAAIGSLKAIHQKEKNKILRLKAIAGLSAFLPDEGVKTYFYQIMRDPSSSDVEKVRVIAGFRMNHMESDLENLKKLPLSNRLKSVLNRNNEKTEGEILQDSIRKNPNY